jgi:hypothetical protein
MKVHRDVVIDLLPVYFSGEASPATKELVEDCFRVDPELERIARSANRPVEVMKVAPVPSSAWEEKLALELGRERARVRAEAWHTSALTALLFSVATAMFTIRDHILVFTVWQSGLAVGLVFPVVACIAWIVFWLGKSRYSLLTRSRRLLNWALYFTFCLAPVLVLNVINLALKAPPITSWWVLFPLAVTAAGLWIGYLFERRKGRAD